MTCDEILNWLLEGDTAIQFQVHKDLLGVERKDIQDKIVLEGWGAHFLSKRKPDGHWGDKLYQPKWTSTFYTLLDLRNLNLPHENETVHETIQMILNAGKSFDGGLPLVPSTLQHSDVCINGMFLNIASYFKVPEIDLTSIVDSILDEKMKDGGFNCRTTRSGATHSSLHTTLSVMEGFTEFQLAGYQYRKKEINSALASALEFILLHRLYLSDRTGRIIHKDFLKLTYPCRWRYDILRAMDYFQHAEIMWDDRMQPAMDEILKKRNKDGTWNMQAAHPGQVHFVMELAGKPGRWNTLRVLRVLNHFGLKL